jgi:hypothetical protein
VAQSFVVMFLHLNVIDEKMWFVIPYIPRGKMMFQRSDIPKFYVFLMQMMN